MGPRPPPPVPCPGFPRQTEPQNLASPVLGPMLVLVVFMVTREAATA
ncbi:hypothetical protein [Nocardiopsis quinghaiensis]|nr:hypothetical protein [Nocardiopsis quinghaiensis]